jgi:CMP/dCMP kinase
MKITISGIVGSGKSTIAKLLAKKLGYKYYSVGGFMRDIAIERNLHLSELSKIAEKDKTIDYELDERQKKLNKTADNFVMDSRLGFYFISRSYKIFLTVDLDAAAKRIFNAARGEEKYDSLEECRNYLEKRINSEKLRYKQYYNVDFPTISDFDLVIDTTSKTPEEILEEISKHLKSKIN